MFRVFGETIFRTNVSTRLEMFSLLPFDHHVFLPDRFHVAHAVWSEPGHVGAEEQPRVAVDKDPKQKNVYLFFRGAQARCLLRLLHQSQAHAQGYLYLRR